MCEACEANSYLQLTSCACSHHADPSQPAGKKRTVKARTDTPSLPVRPPRSEAASRFFFIFACKVLDALHACRLPQEPA